MVSFSQLVLCFVLAILVVVFDVVVAVASAASAASAAVAVVCFFEMVIYSTFSALQIF